MTILPLYLFPVFLARVCFDGVTFYNEIILNEVSKEKASFAGWSRDRSMCQIFCGSVRSFISLLKTWSLGASRRSRSAGVRDNWLGWYKMIWNIGMLGYRSVEDPVFSGIGTMKGGHDMLKMVVMACCLSR